MRLFCWNINALEPTVRNIKYAQGSLQAWFESELNADLVCLQVSKAHVQVFFGMVVPQQQLVELLQPPSLTQQPPSCCVLGRTPVL